MFRLGAAAAAAQPALLVALSDTDQSVRGDAVRTLVALKPTSAQITAPMLRMLGQETETPVLLEVIQAVQTLPLVGRQVVTSLTNLLLTHPDVLVRAKSLDALKKLDLSLISIDTLLKCLANEKDRAIRDGVDKLLAQQLDHLGAAQTTELKPVLRQKDTTIIIRGLETVIRLGSKGEEALPEVLDLVDSQRTRGQALKALEAIGRASIPGLVEIMKKQTAAEKLEIATLLISIDKRDKRVTDAVVPVLVAALRPKDINEPVCRPVIELIKTVGKPCVKEIFKALAAADDRGGVNANNRKFLFMALEQLGAEAYSEDNVERLRQYKQKEKFVDVQAAATKAILAMSSR